MMNLRFCRQLCRFTLHGLFLLTSAALPLIASAAEFECGNDMAASTAPSNPCEFELDGTEELCGWVTHDSCAPPRAAAKQVTVSTSVATFDSSVTVIATAACASAGVSVEQIVEPFAMVGPYLGQSIESVRRFQSWWDAAVKEAEALRTADADIETDIQTALDTIAAQEPVDVENFGASVLEFPVEQSDTLQVGIHVAPLDKLVGGSAIIATIEDSYLPYDLSARDMKVWSVFPTSTHPFCVRSRMEDLDSSPMWQEFEAAVHSQSDVHLVDDSYACIGSAECLLDELIWKMDYLAVDSPVWDMLQPNRIGRHLESLVSQHSRIAARAAQLLASNWPEVESVNEPSAAGEALLARAGATQASEPLDPIAAAEAEVAEAPSGTILR